MEEEDAPRADTFKVDELQEQLEVLRIELADAKAEVSRHTYLLYPHETSTFGGTACELPKVGGTVFPPPPTLDRLLTALSCS